MRPVSSAPHATMYPDWLSLTGEGYVPSMYKKYGASHFSPMGCRALPVSVVSSAAA